MDETRKNILAESLYLRRETGERIDYRPISGDPDRMRGRCHENVADWITDHPTDIAVRGWLYDEGAHDGTARFHSHSVIERGGKIFEITYKDNPHLFIRHIGDSDEFMELAGLRPPTVSHVYDREKAAVFRAALEFSLASGGGRFDEENLLDDGSDELLCS